MTNTFPGIVMQHRRGFTLLELTVASALMAVLLAASLQMLRALSDHQRAAERRAIAMQAVQAVAERIANLPWDQLTTEAAQQTKIPPSLASRLPGAKLTAAVAEEPTPLSKRIEVQVGWTDTKGQGGAPIRLTSWAFPDKTAK
jgi:prepilin-type N-terminal cleavage/methylation domain-containing protein